MVHIVPMIGQSVGRLFVVDLAPPIKGKTRYLCRCICGNEVIIRQASLRSGQSKSCGCLRKELSSSRNRTHGQGGKRFRTTEYNIWCDAKARCLNHKNKDYENYGGRGIGMCEEWRTSFETFFKDMGRRPKGHSLDRIDNSKGYCKENCRWTTLGVQGRNKRTNILVEIDGKTMVLADVVLSYGVNYSKLHYYYTERKLPIEQAIKKALGVL